MRKASLSVVNLKVIAVIGPFAKIAVKDAIISFYMFIFIEGAVSFK